MLDDEGELGDLNWLVVEQCLAFRNCTWLVWENPITMGMKRRVERTLGKPLELGHGAGDAATNLSRAPSKLGPRVPPSIVCRRV